MKLEKLHDLYFSPYVIRLIESRKMTLMDYVAYMGERGGADRVLVVNLRKETTWKI
jgi:hypothetical protein